MQVKRIKRHVSGVLLLDKPLGLSSNQALQQVKRLYNAAKAGHSGSLDPLATGLLPICLGEATKFSHFLLDADKRYHALVKLGSTTSTGDAEGEVLRTADVNVTAKTINAALKQYTGVIQQMPPMYSALKHQGKALYEYARQGVEIERARRTVTIHHISLNAFQQDTLDITVGCSKGTYIRTLAEDIGNALGCGAHLAGLRRLLTAHFELADAYTIEQLEAMSLQARDACLLPPDAAIQNLPVIKLDADGAYYLGLGQQVWQAGLMFHGLLRLYDLAGNFLGLGEATDDGKIAPKRLIVNQQSEFLE